MGECQKNKHWMDDNCQLACNSCDRPPVRRTFSTAIRQPSPAPRPAPTTRRFPVPQPPPRPLPRQPSPVLRFTPPTTRRTFPPVTPFVTQTRVTSSPFRPPSVTRFFVRVPPTTRRVPPTTPRRTSFFAPPVTTRAFSPPRTVPTPPPTTRPPATQPTPPPFIAFPRVVTAPPAPRRGPMLGSLPGNLSPLQKCALIRNDPSNAAEVLLREDLVFAREDISGRFQTLSADKVIRSNIANACVPRLDSAECERSLCYNLYFRTMDGTCNNFRFPLRGAAYRPYNRLLPPEYDNGLSEPASSLFPVRPTPREANRNILSSPQAVLHEEFNALIMQFGQFMSHDMAKTTLVPSAKCNVCQNIPGRCMAVFIQPQDPNQG
uniref:ShKT domain-containing protein n=1 Tax=Acrobeloides nanus TaxID=290746 RepID=A0A914DU66_9BILA